MWEAFVLISLFLFVIGAVVGSFLNVVIYRTVTDETWITGRSRCDHCLKQIAWYDNIPLLSFIWLKGKCRHCRTPISLSHPVVEFITGSLFIWWYWVGSLFFQLSQKPFQTLQPMFWLLVGLLLLVIFFADLFYMIIPDMALILLGVLVIFYRLILVYFGIMQVNDLVMSVAGAGVFSLLFWLLWYFTKGRGMGYGDVKFMIPMSLLLGWPNIMVGVFSAFILGAVVGVGLLISKKRHFGQVIPFGPFLVLATFIALVWGEQLVSWYLSLL